MNVFISWSGEKSKKVAFKLRDWLPDIIQAVKPWMSSEDIEAGARWNIDISKQLESTSFGIICLTKANQTRPWIMFEAGALAKVLQGTFVVPYLIDLKPSEVEQGPLSQFQAKGANKADTLQLLQTLNRSLNAPLNDERLRHIFDKFWPELEEVLNELPDENPNTTPTRSNQDKVDEILLLVRGISRRQQNSTSTSTGSRRIFTQTPNIRSDLISLFSKDKYLSKHLRELSRASWGDFLLTYIDKIWPGLGATELRGVLIGVYEHFEQKFGGPELDLIAPSGLSPSKVEPARPASSGLKEDIIEEGT
ncbi:MAG: toll/interleukin-1 receptor domain-containing protein [Chloroflexia bacterium]